MMKVFEVRPYAKVEHGERRHFDGELEGYVKFCFLGRVLLAQLVRRWVGS